MRIRPSSRVHLRISFLLNGALVQFSLCPYGNRAGARTSTDIAETNCSNCRSKLERRPVPQAIRQQIRTVLYPSR